MPFATVNPATGETEKEFPAHTPEEVDALVQRAADAFSTYRTTTYAERARHLITAAELLEAEVPDLARILTTEMGKTFAAAKAEVSKCAAGLRWFAGNAEQLLADQPVTTSAARSYVRYEPLGVVLAVMPWNFPLWQVIRFAAPALMLGNCGLLKHASNVPQTGAAIEDLFRRAGLPEGVFTNLYVQSKDVAALIEDPRIVAVTLTGSEQAGMSVAAVAGHALKKSVLELGGSDPFIVLPSADLDACVRTAVTARVQNNGQSCIAAKRFIVSEKIAAEFERKFVQRMQELRVGDPFDPSTQLGPLVNPDAVTTLDADVKKTVAGGARVLTGGHPLKRPGNYYPPTVLTDIPKDSPAYKEEFFGPVASIFRVKDVDQAIQIANDCRFGLGASAWTNDPAEAERFINELDAGMVFLNKMVASDPRLPFGGVKYSGHGRELAVQGIREFVNIKTVWIQ